MDPSSVLQRLRAKHGVSEDFSRRFLPLVERAVRTSPEVRHRILELVERSFARQARRSQERAGEDRRLLERVARILERWEPAPWLQRWIGEPGPDAESA